MISVRKIARCHDVKGAFHIVEDFFGYPTGAPQPLSLMRQLELSESDHTHVNIIRVGSDGFSDEDDVEIDRAIAIMRDLFAAVDLGVVIGTRQNIRLDDADGMENITSDSEAEDLTEEFDVSDGNVDIYIVQSIAGPSVVIAPVGGPSGKKGKMRGVVLALESTTNATGFAMARGVASYLGLASRENENNLMFGTVPNGGSLTDRQGFLLKRSEFSWFGCGPHLTLRLSGGF